MTIEDIEATLNAMYERTTPLPCKVQCSLSAAAKLGIDTSSAAPGAICTITPTGWSFDRLLVKWEFE